MTLGPRECEEFGGKKFVWQEIGFVCCKYKTQWQRKPKAALVQTILVVVRKDIQATLGRFIRDCVHCQAKIRNMAILHRNNRVSLCPKREIVPASSMTTLRTDRRSFEQIGKILQEFQEWATPSSHVSSQIRGGGTSHPGRDSLKWQSGKVAD